jgi:hypothetical protein
MTVGGHDDTGPAALEPFIDLEWGGAAGVLAELSRLLEGGRCDWLEAELCPGVTTREERAGVVFTPLVKEASNESGCCDMDPSATVCQVRQQGHNRRYDGGKHCVYCLWFDPNFKGAGDECCKHVLRAVEEWQSQASPSIQPGSLLQVVSSGFTRPDGTRNLLAGPAKFASYMRWRRLYRRGRRDKGLKKAKVGHKVPAASL